MTTDRSFVSGRHKREEVMGVGLRTVRSLAVRRDREDLGGIGLVVVTDKGTDVVGGVSSV